MLEEKSNVLRWVVEKVPFLRDIEGFRTEVIDCGKNTVRAYKLVKAAKPVFNDLPKMEKKLKAENLSDSEKQTLGNQMEELVEKIDEMYTEWIRITGVHTREFIDISSIRSHYQDLIKLYRHSKD